MASLPQRWYLNVGNGKHHGRCLFSEKPLLLLMAVALLTKVSSPVANGCYLLTLGKVWKPRQCVSILMYIQITKIHCWNIYSDLVCLWRVVSLISFKRCCCCFMNNTLRSRELEGFSQTSACPKGFRQLNIHIVGFIPRISDSLGLGWVLWIWISNKFPGYVEADGLGTPI